ncbi:MAG: response regulator [Candidatus Thiodiazotropha sp. (ex Dulcina madagascariensis)]|nr:response regulator [Candidatus Thiodiazotropha sp. (ex Dulcina madagascariensis)]
MVSAMTLIVVLVATGFYLYTAAGLERNFNRKVEETLSYLDGTLGRLLWYVDHDTAARVAETVLRDDLVVGVTIRDEQKRNIISIGEQNSDDVLLRTHSIRFRDRTVGELKLIFSRAPLAETLTNILLISLSVWLLAALSIGVLTNLFIRKYFRGPLLSFTDLAEAYRQHLESPPLSATPFLEFQPIEGVVKKLANDVLLRLRELDDHRKHLETEVAERTRDLRVARDEAEAARTKAEVANQAKSIFLANMSHELRTPLNAILGFSEMLGRGRDTTTDQQEKLGIINRSGEHLLAMINDVLDLSKIEAGRIELEPEAFDLPWMLQDIGRMFEMRAAKAELRFELELDPALARYVKTDAGKLRQILINLLGNAVKFTREGEFALRARTLPVADDPLMVTLQLEVEDNGPGIEPEQLKCIFEPFVQAQAGRSAPQGTGLGLAITKTFIELMGGEISVESKLGEGSLFRVELPTPLADALEAGGVEAAKPVVLGLESGQTAWRILVAEDNVENRLLLSSLLRQAGFDIREAENGEQAITLFEQWQPHFIWMDMRMPVMDGYEAAAKIRSLPGGDEVKIVAITASSFKEQRKTILESGCNDVVHKPFKRYEIFDAMADQLGVRYTYEEAVAELVSALIEVSAEAVAALPKELLEKLRIAARSLSNEAFEAALIPVREHNPDLAEGLSALAREFRFDRILELLGDKGKSDE